jgi:nucleotide-binding universal stress UspA family protein
MIYFAYDGSLNGDWVSRYAIRFAAHTEERRLTLVHIRDKSVRAEILEEKIARIDRECGDFGIRLLSDIRPVEKNVSHSLLESIPAGPDSVVVCGTRIHSPKKAYLAGTISEKLLRHGRFPVLVQRVVQPGLLGNPRDLLIALAGHPRGFATAWTFFQFFLPDVEKVHLLRVMPVNVFSFPHLSLKKTRSLRREGAIYLSQVAEEIYSARGVSEFHLDTHIVVAEDWVGEILTQASKLKSRFLLLGATEQSRLRRLVRRGQLERLLGQTPCDAGIYRGL